MSTRQVDARLCAETNDGYMVVSIARDRYFSVTGEIYRSQRAYELGTGNPHTCGALHDEIIAAFPQLAPIVAMHLSDVETGEPMNGPTNGWYRISGADMLCEIDSIELRGHGNYYEAPEPYINDDGVIAQEMPPDDSRSDFYLAPAFAQFFVDLAARSLHMPVDMLPNVQDQDLFKAWVEDVARPYWRRRAAKAHALIDSLPTPNPDPSERECDVFYIELDAGLNLYAKVMEDGYRDGVGAYHQYAVTISDGSYCHACVYGGSVADYDAGFVNAREAAFNMARELFSFQYETARGYIEETCCDDWDELPRDQREALEAAERAFDAMQDALMANEDVLS